MANVQKQFESFHGLICLGRFKENDTLREKRDIIRKRVETRIGDVFKKYGEECPEIEWCDLGSYAIGTGVKPIDCDFDIDQGLFFKIDTSRYPNPVVLKERVHEALTGHTDSVEIRRPCVTVFYHMDEEPVFHVDIAVFSSARANFTRKNYLARGKPSSPSHERIWEVADPEGLLAAIKRRFAKGPERDQFRRVVRYLKRWKDWAFSTSGTGAPIGIGLTVAAYQWFSVIYSDVFAKTPDDMQALRTLVTTMRTQFADVWDANENAVVRRLSVYLPVDPRADLFAKMTAAQMRTFEEQLRILSEALDYASTQVDPMEACRRLAKVFGDDFPVPSIEETAKKHAPAIVSSSNSA
jgi:hypothetical protein